ncbi:hypothetical protein [Caviibacter abscessus]|uniref:hypothetical protein n=1 Tax=Caviibacter abscessus TaxID=1766719 RepID=UPI000832BAC1|nr:hypothetical protein [Caviibacter abscessus]
MEIDKKEFLEHTKVFENHISNTLENGLLNLDYKILSQNKDSPCIYTVLLSKSEALKYDYFLKEIVEDENISIYSKYLDTVYIDKNYYDLLEMENNTYIGEFILKEERYVFKYILIKDERYDVCINKLYDSFMLNNLKWYSIDKRDINKMYRVKVIEYVDDITLLENIPFEDIKIEYNFDNTISNYKKVYWNIGFETKLLNKEITRFNDIVAYKYILDKTKKDIYLLNENSSKIDDVCIYDTRIDVYSKYDNIYIFDMFHIFEFDFRFNFKYCKSICGFNNKIVGIESIKKFLYQTYKLKLTDFKITNKNIGHLIIPNYDNQIITYNLGYLYLKFEKIYSYEDLFHAINLLKLNINGYEIRVIE